MKVIKPNTIDITTDGSFSRSTTGTYIDSDGVMKTAAINVPRFDYDPFALTFKGLIIEAAATNLVSHSESFDNAAWLKTAGLSVTANTTFAPDGLQTADTINCLNSGANYGYRSTGTLTVGGTYTASIFVRDISIASNEVLFFRTYTDVGYVTFSLSTLEVVTSGSFISGTIEKAYGEWYRLTGTFIAQTASQNITLVGIFSTSGAQYAAWGAQLEVGPKATSYIPTTTSTVTRAADVVTGSNLIYSTVTEATAAWSSGTTYALAAKVRYLNQIWESLQASNLNKAPNTNPTWWVLIGPDNLHAPFDLSVSTKSTMPTIQTMVIKPGAFDSIALIEVDAEVIEVSATDYTGKEIYYSGTFGLSGAIVYDWYQYFFESLTEERTQILVQGLLAVYPEAVITVRLRSAIGVNNSIGALIAGITTEIGGSQYGISAGITDYSRKDTDEFGNITFIQRNYSKRLSADVYFPNTEINKVQRFLYSIRAQPVVWVGSDDPTYEEPLVVFGFYRDFSTTIAYPTHSLCSIEVEGLT